ncbi:MAG: hypothetical protein JXR48_05575 [Candidatus Delongbacteria bacterium]|nr:hypothetical protein [Candidatus Delongbacteria bacterium]MBN2834419.1 hypothetical protein [Candidatus Delongbacteria bacterium]
MLGKVFIISIAVMILACSKSEKNYTIQKIGDVEVVRNKNIPTFTKTELKLDNLVEINGPELSDSLAAFYEPRFVKLDKNNDIYIADDKSCSIKRFNKNGSFLNKIGGKGNGPGEFEYFSNIFFFEDTICVTSPPNENRKFSKNGEFFLKTHFSKNILLLGGMLEQLTGRNYIASYLSFDLNDVKPSSTIKCVTSIFEEELVEKVKVIEDSLLVTEYREKPYKLSEIQPIITFDGKSRIYLTKKSKEKYEIHVYNFEGKQANIIVKSYRKIPFSDAQIQKIKEFNKGNKAFIKQLDYKHSIERMMVDKYDNMWVKSGDLYDVFDNKGIYNGLVDFKTFNLSDDPEYLNNNTISFENDKIIITDYENSIVRVYDYEVSFSN